MNIIIPAAGRGKRFAEKGITTPKPFIDVLGKPMIQVAIENLNLRGDYYLIMQRAHYNKYAESMYYLPEGAQVILTDEVTDGPACSCLLAKDFIDNDEPLLYANCDQFIEWNPDRFLFDVRDFDGGLLMYRDKSECGSFAVMDESCYVKRTVEKEVVSDVSSTGIYYWRHGSDFVKYAERMIEANHRAKNGEFYAINVYNEGIKDGQKYVVSFIKNFWRLGVPEELTAYVETHSNHMAAII